MAESFENRKVKLPNVIGSTTINHAARIQLGLNCTEYVLMDYIYRKVVKKQGFDITDVYKHTGFDETQQRVLSAHLIQKGFIFPEHANPPKISDKWVSAFTDMEREFDEMFWKMDGKVFWPGSKKKAFSFYYRVRKNFSRDFLVEQRNQYARYLTLERMTGFDRRVMMAERWLNPSNAYYETDWKQMADEIDEKVKKNQARVDKANQKIEKTQTITPSDRKKQYEQDSNQ